MSDSMRMWNDLEPRIRALAREMAEREVTAFRHRLVEHLERVTDTYCDPEYTVDPLQALTELLEKLRTP
jgi:hypothetical protein